MDRSKKVRLIQQIRDVIDSMRWDDTDMVLEMFGFGAVPEGPDGFNLAQWLQNGSDADLLALGRHLGVSAAADAPDTAEASAAPSTDSGGLFVFASHLFTKRAFVGEVEARLQVYGVKLFVAHDSIPIDALWESEIVDALRTCNAGTAFLHEGIHDSYYCMQEVGWLLGRGVHIARVICDEAPKGLLGSKQGIIARGLDAVAVAEALIDYFLNKPELQPMLSTSLAQALRDSPNFEQTDLIWWRLSKISGLSAAQCELLVEAAEDNSQVFWARSSWNGPRYRSTIADFLNTQSASGGLADRIRELRIQADTDLRIQPPHKEPA